MRPIPLATIMPNSDGRIDAHRPLFDQRFARLVRHQRRLLLRAHDRNEAHASEFFRDLTATFDQLAPS
jgi:hypothetical protein